MNPRPWRRVAVTDTLPFVFGFFFVAAYAVVLILAVAALVAAQVPRGDFHANGRRLIAVPRAWVVIISAIGPVFFSLLGLASLIGGATPALRFYPVVFDAGMVMFQVGAGLLSLSAFSNITIDRDGVTVRGSFTRRFVPWVAMSDPVTAIAEAGITGRGLPILPGRKRILSLRRMGVERDRVIDVITWYIEHPEARPNIGNPADLARISPAITAAA
jgi:hypothetical protein